MSSSDKIIDKLVMPKSAVAVADMARAVPAPESLVDTLLEKKSQPLGRRLLCKISGNMRAH